MFGSQAQLGVWKALQFCEVLQNVNIAVRLFWAMLCTFVSVVHKDDNITL